MKNHWKPGNLNIRKLMSHFSETLCTSCKVPIKPFFFFILKRVSMSYFAIVSLSFRVSKFPVSRNLETS
ncbi:hypothetical protein BC826DRAFT_1067614, partial [Russula brevipes]